LRRRWRELPVSARTPGQVLGRHGVGCEGTHGVFPKCNLACTPCYHSRDANQVRVDGPHTLARIEEQMALLERRRGPHGHAQLIGGEVSLLSPDDHAEALAIMRRHGREPMSFTHGDVDYDYLQKLVIGPAAGAVSTASPSPRTSICSCSAAAASRGRRMRPSWTPTAASSPTR